MKVTIGFHENVIGIFDLDKDGELHLTGNKAVLKNILDMKHENIPMKEFLQDLPNRLRHYIWAKLDD